MHLMFWLVDLNNLSVVATVTKRKQTLLLLRLIARHMTLQLFAQNWNIVFFKFLCLHFFFSLSSCFFRGGFYWGRGNAFIQRWTPPQPHPPTKHTHKHTADGASVTFQNVKWFCMLVGWCLKWLWGAFTYLWIGVVILDDCIQVCFSLILLISQRLIRSNHHYKRLPQEVYCSLPAV